MFRLRSEDRFAVLAAPLGMPSFRVRGRAAFATTDGTSALLLEIPDCFGILGGDLRFPPPQRFRTTTAVIGPASHSSAAEGNIHGSKSNDGSDRNRSDCDHRYCGNRVYYFAQATQPEAAGTLWAGV